MKRFALSALVLTALACPASANDEFAAEVVVAEPELLVEECVVDDGAGSEVERCDTVVDDSDPSDYVKRDFGGEDPVDDSTGLDGHILTTMTGGENTENTEDDPSIIYMMSSSTGGGGADASLSVNQLADEQRTSLRLFSGRESTTEHTGRAANLKEMFGGRSRVKVEAEAASPAVSAGEREIAQRKAEIDQLRDKALRTGDAALMARADAMAAAQTKGEVKGRSFFGFRRK
jgi:hypothetical protein